jgi:hypothetical protein
LRSSAVKSLISRGRYGWKRPLVVFTRWKSQVQSLQRPQPESRGSSGVRGFFVFTLARNLPQPNHLHNHFDGYASAPRSRRPPPPAREYGGAGLGLTIASALIALMKGTLTIESTPNIGTTVRFTVSLEREFPEDGFFMADHYAPCSDAG